MEIGVTVLFYGWPKAEAFVAAYRAAGFLIAGHFTFLKRYTSRTGYVGYQHENAQLQYWKSTSPRLRGVASSTIPQAI